VLVRSRGQLSTHDDYEAKGRKDIGRDRCDTRLQPRTIRLTGSSSEVRPGLKGGEPHSPSGLSTQLATAAGAFRAHPEMAKWGEKVKLN
jgi:hypothetical protein